MSSNKRMAIIVDLDGTLCNSKHREHHLYSKEGKPDWATWDSLVHLDTPNEWCVKLVTAMRSRGCILIFLTGRGERIREPTQTWLAANLPAETLKDSILLMRGLDDRRPDTVVKMRHYRRTIEPQYEVLFCVDDRDTVVDMFRKIDLTVLHCDRWGDDKEVEAAKWLTTADEKEKKDEQDHTR
jgi:predicted secreted acid phosphatase